MLLNTLHSQFYIYYIYFRYFINAEHLHNAKAALQAEVLKVEELKTLLSSDETVPKVLSKTPWMESASSLIGSIFNEILEDSPTAAQPSGQITPGEISEMEGSLCEAIVIERKNNPIHYRRVNQALFPTLAATAAPFLCAPCTSVESEGLFSTVSIIIEEHRGSLTAQHA